MKRRTLLHTGLAGVVGTTAGCSGLLEQGTAGPAVPTVVEDRPDGVYHPTHVEGMKMVDTRSVGDRTVGLFYSYPHRFWTVTGTQTNMAAIEDDHSVHLMASTWDSGSGTVIPVLDQPKFTIARDGSEVDGKRAWPMLSQNMGFHFGENMALDGDGTYDVTVEVGAVGGERVGAFEGRFEESITAEFTFEYSESEKNDITYVDFPDEAGTSAAAPRMKMDMPLSFAPDFGAFPGTPATVGSVGDAEFVASVDGGTVVVSPRTPYNGFSIPGFALSADVGGVGSELTAAVGPDLGAHYRAELPETPPEDPELTVTVDGPTSVSRHEGYETAFLERGSASTGL